MRTLAIDLGARRVGLALSDESARLASPLQVLEVSSEQDAARRVTEIAQKEDVLRLVVGLPLNMDDTIGPAAKSAARWSRELAKLSGLPVILVDERLSSFAADQSMSDQKRQGRKMTHKAKKQRRDAIAAADFLQAFLDGRLKPIEPDTVR
jgi:putative Holliday junction resolvase